MKKEELEKLSEIEINKKIRETADELLKLRLKKQLGQLKNPAHMVKLRRFVALMKTILRERTLLAKKAADIGDMELR